MSGGLKLVNSEKLELGCWIHYSRYQVDGIVLMPAITWRIGWMSRKIWYFPFYIGEFGDDVL